MQVKDVPVCHSTRSFVYIHFIFAEGGRFKSPNLPKHQADGSIWTRVPQELTRRYYLSQKMLSLPVRKGRLAISNRIMGDFMLWRICTLCFSLLIK